MLACGGAPPAHGGHAPDDGGAAGYHVQVRGGSKQSVGVAVIRAAKSPAKSRSGRADVGPAPGTGMLAV